MILRELGDPEEEVDAKIHDTREKHIASVHEKGSEQPVCEEEVIEYPYDGEGWDHIDDVSGRLLNNTMVQEARAEEIEVIKEMGVWEVVPRDPNTHVYGTRWVDINKGDEEKPNYRSNDSNNLNNITNFLKCITLF